MKRGQFEHLHEHLIRINEKVNIIMATMQDLQASVQRNTDAEESFIEVLEGVSQQLKDAQAQNDPQAIQSVIDQLDANTAKMAASAVQNTQADPSSQAAQAQAAQVQSQSGNNGSSNS